MELRISIETNPDTCISESGRVNPTRTGAFTKCIAACIDAFRYPLLTAEEASTVNLNKMKELQETRVRDLTSLVIATLDEGPTITDGYLREVVVEWLMRNDYGLLHVEEYDQETNDLHPFARKVIRQNRLVDAIIGCINASELPVLVTRCSDGII